MTRQGVLFTALVAALLAPWPARGQDPPPPDRQVQGVLERMRGRWRDMNIPEQDGRILHGIVVEHGFTRALEIGTSTGHSGLWIAWALSKTGGRLITLEIDDARRREAVARFAEAGLGPIVDARHGDAHALVETLAGPFDFVFIDADKDWYTNYAKALIPKLAPGGCITAHNVREPGSPGWAGHGGAAAYYAYMKGRPEFDTSIHPESVGGISVSCRRADTPSRAPVAAGDRGHRLGLPTDRARGSLRREARRAQRM